MKKITSVILVFVLTFAMATLVFADTNDSSQQEESKIENQNTDEPKVTEVIELSLEEAIEYALKNNRSIKIQDLNIQKQEVSYEETKKMIKEYEKTKELVGNYPVPADAIVEKKLMDLGVTKRSNELAMQLAKWNKEIETNDIKYNVEKGYFDLSQAQKELEIAKEGLELAKKQYEQSKLMYDLGTISQQQLTAIELGVSQAQIGVNGATMAYELQKMNFNNVLGLPLDQQVVLTDSIEYKDHEEIVLEDSITEALNTNISIKVVNENYEISKLMLQATKTRYPEITYRYREKAVAVETAAKNLESAKIGIEMGVRASYLSLITAEKQISTYELAVQQAEKALELAQISFELGQNTATEVNQARLELMTAKKNLSQQIHAYNLALLDFKYSTGLGKNQI